MTLRRRDIYILNSEKSNEELAVLMDITVNTVREIKNRHDKKTLDLIQRLLNTLSPKQKESQ